MNAQVCEREEELLDALGRGFVGPELTEHLGSCGSCSELHLVAGALLDDRTEAVNKAAVPTSGTMWWRMQVRQRHEAQSSARRSLLIGQAVTISIALFLTISLLGPTIATVLRAAVPSIQVSTPLLVVMLSWIVVAPIAGYVALRHK
jgi:predicted anti-sigma-YlaC factor YlaD